MTAPGARAMASPKAAFSNTVFHGSRPKCWNTMATPGGGPLTGVPSTRSRPLDRSMRPPMLRNNVVLPQPLGPTTHRISCARTARLSWWNATTVPSRNTLLAFSARMAGAARAAAVGAPADVCVDPSIAPALLRLSDHLLGDWAPSADLLLDEGRERLGRHFLRLHRLLIELAAHVGMIEGLDDLLVQPVDDVFRHVGRPGDREPRGGDEVVIAQLLEGGHGGEIRQALGRRHSQR